MALTWVTGMSVDALLRRPSPIFSYRELMASLVEHPGTWDSTVAARAAQIRGVLGGEHTLGAFPLVEVPVPRLSDEAIASAVMPDLRPFHRDALKDILRICRDA